MVPQAHGDGESVALAVQVAEGVVVGIVGVRKGVDDGHRVGVVAVSLGVALGTVGVTQGVSVGRWW